MIWDIHYKEFSIESVVASFNGILRTFGYSDGKIFSFATVLNGCMFIVVVMMAYSIYENIQRKKTRTYSGRLLSFYLFFAVLINILLYAFTDMPYADRYFFPIMIFAIPVIAITIGEIQCNLQAKKLENPNVHFECYDGKKIPYQNESFDMILIACVLHHVPHEEHEKLLTECKRVLKENGCIYVFEHNPWNPLTRKIVNDCEFDKDAVLVSGRRLMKTMKQAGFCNMKIYYTIFFPRKGIFRKILQLEKLLKWLPFGGQYYIQYKK